MLLHSLIDAEVIKHCGIMVLVSDDFYTRLLSPAQVPTSFAHLSAHSILVYHIGTNASLLIKTPTEIVQIHHPEGQLQQVISSAINQEVVLYQRSQPPGTICSPILKPYCSALCSRTHAACAYVYLRWSQF